MLIQSTIPRGRSKLTQQKETYDTKPLMAERPSELDSYTRKKISRVVSTSLLFAGLSAVLPPELGSHLSRTCGVIGVGFGGISLADKLQGGPSPSDRRFLACLGLQIASVGAGGVLGHVLHTNFGMPGRVASGVLAGIAIGLVD